MKQERIVEIINDVYEAVEKSKAGKIVEKIGNKEIIHYVGLNSYIAILTALIKEGSEK